MKKLVFLTLAALLLAVLCCACSAEAPAQEEPAQAEPSAVQTEPAEPAEQPQPEPIRIEPVPVKTGVTEENGAFYYYAQDGSRVEKTGMQTLDGAQYYLNRDYSLHEFVPGLNDCGGIVYIHAGEAGFVFTPHEPGILELDNALYEVATDGSVLQDASDGYLYFGPDGRYTSGNETLDEGVRALLIAACEETASREEKLRQAYAYIRDNYRYLSMQHYDAGTTDWAEEAAAAFLETGKGNCYCFAGLFMYCARQLGYQAYVVAGWESKPTNDHAWTMIEQDGKALLYDAQLEYAYLYMFGREPIDMFGAEEQDGLYRGFRYYFPE